MADKPNNNRQVFYKNRNIKPEPNKGRDANNNSVLDPNGLIAETGNPKAYYFPNNLSSYAAGNILRFSIFKYQGGGYKAELEAVGGSDAIADLPTSEKVADIYLPEPSNGQVSYSPNWSAINTGGTGEMVNLLASYKKNRNSMTDEVRSTLQGQLITQGLWAGGKMLNAFTDNKATGIIESGFQAGLGYYMQEFKETLFNGINNRNFKYTFNLIPTSPSDLILISNIIQLFKWSSVPGLVDIPTMSGDTININMTNKLFQSPEIIQIRHMTKVKGSSGDASNENDSLEINPWINKHLPSVLTSVSIDFGSSQAKYLMTYVQERSSDLDKIEEVSSGAPLMYTLNLTFTELTVLSKTAVNNGY